MPVGGYVYAFTPALIRKEAFHGLCTFVNRWQMGEVGTNLNHLGTNLQKPPEIQDRYTRNATLCFLVCFLQKLGTNLNQGRNQPKFKTATDGMHVCACRAVFYYNTKEKPARPGTTPRPAHDLVL